MNTLTMDTTSSYTDSLINQALSLPDLLRPLLMDENTRDASAKLGELASEMKSIANVSSHLVTRCQKMKDVFISAESQIKLQDAINDAKELSKSIAEKSISLKNMKFSISWQANKLTKFAKKTYINIEKVEKLLSPYFDSDPFALSLMKPSQKSTDSLVATLLLTNNDLKKLDSPDTERSSIQGLEKLISDAALAP